MTRWEYDVAGRCVAMGQGNGLVQRQSYDAHGRLVQRALYDEEVPSALMAVELAYDALGNVVKQQERWNQTVGGQVPTSNRTTTMAYDLTSRLVNETAVQHADGHTLSTTYEYDAASNRTRKVLDENGASAGSTLYTYNALNQLTGFEERDSSAVLQKTVTFTYDLNGNRTSRVENGVASHEYAWDWNNRLAHVQKHVGGESGYWYGYDYRMRRTTSQEGTVATAITYSGGVSVAEYQVLDSQLNTLNAQPDVEYQRGPDMGGGVGGLLYSLRSGATKFNLSNGRGDVVAQSDSTGGLTWTASYDANGKRPVEVGSNVDRQRANTKEEDPTGLLYEGWRYRDLETLTWLSRDPAGFVDGPNLYAYVRQNPWTKFDPDGLAEKDPAKIYKVLKGTALRGERAFAGKKVTSAMLEKEYGLNGKVQALKDYEKMIGKKVVVSYDKNGAINLSAYAIDKANIGNFSRKEGGSAADIDAAWAKLAAGETGVKNVTKEQLAFAKENYTWHHTGKDGQLELVPREINDAFPHTGGAAFARSGAYDKEVIVGVVTTGAAFLSSTVEAATGDNPSAKNIAEGVARDVVKPVDAVMSVGEIGAAASRGLMRWLENQVYGPPGENDSMEDYRTK